MSYQDFLARKAQLGAEHGFDLEPPGFLFPFQRALLDWAQRKGRGLVAADCGLGKTPMQLAWADAVVRKTNRSVLVLTPLAVAQQTVREAEKFSIEAKRSAGTLEPGAHIVVTNYEKLHHFRPDDFSAVVCDESSCIKAFDGKRRAEVTEFMRTVSYRSLWTATAAPNDYIELGTASEALGEMGQTDMLSRFFKNDQNTVDGGRMHGKAARWRFKGHAEHPFWKWVCSWARACRKPSDLGFEDDGFALPPLIEREHLVEARSAAPGMLFNLPAANMWEEREERRRTITERCEMAAELVSSHDCSVVWCHLNAEGDLLEQIIPNSLQISGASTDEYKEEAVEWFLGERCICNSVQFRSKLARWRRDSLVTGARIIESIARKGSLNQSATNESTPANAASISSGTTKPTSKSGPSEPRPRRGAGANRNANATPQIQNTEPRGSQTQSATGPSTRSEGPTQPSGSLGLEPMLPSYAGNVDTAPFAGARTGMEGSGSTSTTATRADDSGGCSARIAILDSESSATISALLSEQSCTCGHRGGPRRLIAKPVMFGYGLNLQHCAHVVTFASHSYEQYYQAVRRCWRFGQKRPVVVDLVATEGERGVKENLRRKSEAADRMFSELVAHMNDAMRLERSVRYERKVEAPAWL